MCALAQSRSTAGSCGSCNSLQRILARAAYARTWSVSENWAVASQVQLCVLLCKYHEFHDAMAIAHRALRSQSEGIFPHGRERNMLLWIKINCAEELGERDEAARAIRLLASSAPTSVLVWNKFHEICKGHSNANNILRWILRRVGSRAYVFFFVYRESATSTACPVCECDVM
eukprot:m.641500 g.641500  ORF g.641500 m.641500 type:complete len:173 (+) comp22631_c1_seq6:112-630(+)